MKNLYFLFLSVFMSGSIFSQEAPAFRYGWDTGFWLRTNDTIFSLGFGGNISFDHAYFSQDKELDALYGPLEIHQKTHLRKARIYFHGQIYKKTEFAFQVDFAGDKVSMKDVFIGLTGVPVVQNIRIGHLNEPFRYSTLTSTKFTNFMDRAPNSVFSPIRNTGILLLQNYLRNRISSQVGIFANAGNIANTVAVNDGYALVGRVSGLPVFDESGSHVLHIGVAHNYRKPRTKEYAINVPVTPNMPVSYFNTGILPDVRDVNMTNFEAVYFRGPFTIQSEYLYGTLRSDLTKAQIQNAYGEVSWMLTGERKIYRGSYFGTGKTPIKNNYGWGTGAWEIAGGYSYTDLNHEFLGGIRSDWRLGVNWYLNPAARVMINYVRSHSNNEGNIDVVQGRIQIGF